MGQRQRADLSVFGCIKFITIGEISAFEPGGASGGNFQPQAGFLHSPTTHPLRHNVLYNDIHNTS